MKAIGTNGLLKRLTMQFRLANAIPSSMMISWMPLLLSFNLLPADMKAGYKGLFSDRAKEATPAFLKMLTKSILRASKAARSGEKVILVPFNFPPELIHAFESAVPLTSEVLSTMAAIALPGQGEPYWDMVMGLGLPDHICSSNAIELGSLLGSDDFHPQAIVSSAVGGCDANAKLHEFAANYLEIPHLYLPKPPDDTGRGRRQYSVYVRKLVSQLEQLLGEKLREERLHSVMEKANRCTELYHELMDLRKATPCPVPNVFSLYTYGTRFTAWGTDAGIKTMQTMVDISKKRLKRKAYPAEKERARCLWVYTSYYYDLAGYFNWMEEQGYSHLSDGLMMFFPQTVDTSSMDTMLEGFADAAWGMPMTRQMGAESMSRAWIEDVVWACRELRADCAIFSGHHACKQTWSVVSILQRELMEQVGVRLLVLQGDSWIKRMTPMSVIQQEIDEFVKNAIKDKSRQRRKLKKGRHSLAPGPTT